MATRLLAGVLVVLSTAAFPAALAAQVDQASQPSEISPYLVALSVRNVDASYAWYRTHLGFEVMRLPYSYAPGMRVGFLRRGEFRLELVEAAGSRPRSAALPDTTNQMSPLSLQGFYKLGFQVPDLDALVAHFRTAGIAPRFGPTSDSSFQVRFFIVADPDGNWVQFFQPMHP